MISLKNFHYRLTLSVSLGIVFSSSLIAPAMAQYRNQEDSGYQSNEENPMSGTLGGIDPIDLIHNANLSNGRSAEEFDQDSQQQIQNSAEEFRRLQRERMLQQHNNESKTLEETTP